MTLLELLQLVRKHLKLMIVLPIVCALATAVVCFVALPNTYTASTSMYVLAKQSSANSDNAANYSNLNASQMMANDVSTLLKSDRIEADTAKDLHLESLKGYSTKVTSETTSRVITLSVAGTDPDIAATIANDMASNVSKVAQQVMDVQSVNVIDQATAPTAPSGPNRPMYIAVALLAGLFVAIAIVVVSDMLNTKVRNADEIDGIFATLFFERLHLPEASGTPESIVKQLGEEINDCQKKIEQKEEEITRCWAEQKEGCSETYQQLKCHEEAFDLRH